MSKLMKLIHGSNRKSKSNFINNREWCFIDLHKRWVRHNGCSREKEHSPQVQKKK